MSTHIQPAAPADPSRIGPYRVLGRLGVGGMGVVFAAVDGAGRRTAVKSIHRTLAGDDQFRARFRREVALLGKVQGPCLVPLVGADTEAEVPWLATAYTPGPTLDRAVAAGGPVSGANLHALAVGVVAALAAIHEAGVVHRDLKPANVILAPGGPRVVDFGIAHSLDGTSVTRTGVLTGTPGWISPEHYRTGVVGTPGDVFAWGALIAYAATGRLPFGAGAVDAVAYRVMSGEPDLDGVPDDLLPHLRAALAKEPADRPRAAELAELCGALLAGQATVVPAPVVPEAPTAVAGLVEQHWHLPLPSAEDPAWTVRRRPRTARAAVAVAAVLGLVGGGAAAAVYAGSAPSAPAGARDDARPGAGTAPMETPAPGAPALPVSGGSPSAPGPGAGAPGSRPGGPGQPGSLDEMHFVVPAGWETNVESATPRIRCLVPRGAGSDCTAGIVFGHLADLSDTPLERAQLTGIAPSENVVQQGLAPVADRKAEYRVVRRSADRARLGYEGRPIAEQRMWWLPESKYLVFTLGLSPAYDKVVDEFVASITFGTVGFPQACVEAVRTADRHGMDAEKLAYSDQIFLACSMDRDETRLATEKPVFPGKVNTRTQAQCLTLVHLATDILANRLSDAEVKRKADLYAQKRNLCDIPRG